MTIHLDTSALVAALTGARPAFADLMHLVSASHRLEMSTLVLYEWQRGPRATAELDAQRAIVPTEHLCAFGPEEAALAATLYREVASARSRASDLAIAACALTRGAALWTLNRRDFDDIPGLRLL